MRWERLRDRKTGNSGSDGLMLCSGSVELEAGGWTSGLVGGESERVGRGSVDKRRLRVSLFTDTVS